jgi:hypothetical protein
MLNVESRRRTTAATQVFFIDSNEKKPFPFGAELPRKLKTQAVERIDDSNVCRDGR